MAAEQAMRDGQTARLQRQQAELMALQIQALQGSQTNCNPNEITGDVNCVTLPASGLATIAVDDKCAGRDWLLAGCTMGQAKAARGRIALRTQVTSLLADGKCAEAKATALRGGDIELARQAMSFCPAN
jgi:hypothetical protein